MAIANVYGVSAHGEAPEGHQVEDVLRRRSRRLHYRCRGHRWNYAVAQALLRHTPRIELGDLLFPDIFLFGKRPCFPSLKILGPVDPTEEID
jgi:hypothetical protein